MKAYEMYNDEEILDVDKYGNPLSGDRIINCCFPDCGCDGARLCQAENGASSCALWMNIEHGAFLAERRANRRSVAESELSAGLYVNFGET